MQLTDTHTHLYDEAFGDVRGQDEAVRRAIDAGVTQMIIPDECSRVRAGLLELCGRWPANTRPCIGLHPEEINGSWRSEMDLLYDCAANAHGIVAIGETGLDYHFSREFEVQQQEAFRLQADLALKMDLPMIIHSRDATDAIFRILEDYRGKGLRGVFHAFSGSIETFRRLDRYGQWYVGIGGVLTFKKASIADTVTKIPLDRILLETDSPYLAPVPMRGKRNESAFVSYTAEFLAMKKGIGTEEVAAETTANAATLFRL